MTSEDLIDVSTPFKAYLTALDSSGPTRQILADLYVSCKRISSGIRAKYPKSHRHDYRFDHAEQDAFFKVTDPARARSIDPDYFGTYYLEAVRNGMFDQGRWQQRAKNRADRLTSVHTESIGRDDRAPHDIEVLRSKILGVLSHLTRNQLELYSDYLGAVTDRKGDDPIKGNGIYKQIAESRGIAIGTVKSTLNNVRHRLDPLWEEMIAYQPEELNGLDQIIPELQALINSKRGQDSNQPALGGYARKRVPSEAPNGKNLGKKPRSRTRFFAHRG